MAARDRRARVVEDGDRARSRWSSWMTHGEVVASLRMDGAALDTELNARRKAYTAARSDATTTRALAGEGRQPRPTELASFDPFFSFFLGGVAHPLRRRAGRSGRGQRPPGRGRRAARARRDRLRRARASVPEPVGLARARCRLRRTGRACPPRGEQLALPLGRETDAVDRLRLGERRGDRLVERPERQAGGRRPGHVDLEEVAPRRRCACRPRAAAPSTRPPPARPGTRRPPPPSGPTSRRRAAPRRPRRPSSSVPSR